MKAPLKNHQGLTLIELLVALVLLVVLVVVALPKFNRYQDIARKSEAKLSLSEIFLAEQNFKTANGFYTSCIEKAGYKPLNPLRFYTSGFGTGATNKITCGSNSNKSCRLFDVSKNLLCNHMDGETYFSANTQANPSVPIGNISHINDGPVPITDMTKDKFTAAAAGQIWSTNAQYINVWQIDEKKQLSETWPGGI
jgi:prepilin-type N-terminal cleavage/methylation domain-containing protein